MGHQAGKPTSALGGTGASARGEARTTTEVNALVRSHDASLESHVGWHSSRQTALVGASFELSWCVGAFSLRMWREVGPECSPERQNAPGTAHTSPECVPAWPSETPCALGLPRSAVTLRSRAAPRATLAKRPAVTLRNRVAQRSPTRPSATGSIGNRPSATGDRQPAIGPTRPPPAVPGPWAGEPASGSSEAGPPAGNRTWARGRAAEHSPWSGGKHGHGGS